MKYQNQQKLLSVIAAKMTDYTPDIDGLRVKMVAYIGKGVQATHALGLITVAPCESAWEAYCDGQSVMDPMVLGRRVLRHLAHEFRHSQQELLWDTDIPSVSWAARPAGGVASSSVPFLIYRNDRGEMDAKRYADVVVNSADPAFIHLIGRYARWCCAHQWAEFQSKASAQGS